MDPLRLEIVKKMEKYYLDYKPSVWKKFLKSDGDLKDDFKSVWKTQYGGYYVDNTHVLSVLPTFKSPNTLILPGIASDDEDFQNEYIKTANNILLNINDEVLNIDLRNTNGEKTGIIMAAIIPLFYLTKRKVLTHIVNRDGYYRTDLVRYDNCIISKINETGACGSRKSIENPPNRINVFIGTGTSGAGEQVAIALIALREVMEVMYIGENTAGRTTSNVRMELSNGDIIEVPYGYMADFQKSYYKKFCPDKK